MPFFFRGNTAAYRCDDFLIRRIRFEHGPDIRFLQAEQAIAQLAIGGDAKSITAHAERGTDGGDESNPSDAILEDKIGSGCTLVRLFLWHQRHNPL